MDQLADADAARDRGVDGMDAAVEVYREHVEALDAATEAGRGRVRWLIETGNAYEPCFQGAVRAAAEQQHDEELRLRAYLATAEFEFRAGTPEAAERILRIGLAMARGKNSVNEMVACNALARIYRIQHRPFEALLLSRRAFQLAHILEHPLGLAQALLGAGGILIELADWDETASLLVELEEVARHVPEQRRRELRRQLHYYRFEIALQNGQLDDAHAQFDAWSKSWVAGWQRATFTDALEFCRGRMLAAEGRMDEARVVADAVFDADADLDHNWIDRALLRLRTAPDAALAQHIARRLAEHGLTRLGAGSLLNTARELGELSPDPRVARRAFDLAAAAALERVRQIRECQRELSELSMECEEDRAILLRHRRRFVRRQEEIARLYKATGTDAVPRLAEIGDSGGVITICAWCLEVLLPGGRRVPAGHYVTAAGESRISHGICPECAAQYDA